MTDEPTLILGVESSCDETSAAVVADGRRVLSNVVASQIELHARYGGVVPEIASRAHIEAINTVIAQAIEQAGVNPRQLGAVAVTHEPGLIGSLLVGLMAAKTLAWVWDRPLVGVNHVYAHAYAAALDDLPLEYPAVALVCSGGHTALYRCGGPMELELLGTTIDDAAGEAFDKVANILQLGYPGGPQIDRVARAGNPRAVSFPRSLLSGQSLDFSFSGIKTAVLYECYGRNARGRGTSPPPPEAVPDLAASFQEAVVDVLVEKSIRAALSRGVGTLVAGGGVACNSRLRARLAEEAGKVGLRLRFAAPALCTDNAAMVAGIGYHLVAAGRQAQLVVTPAPYLPFSRSLRKGKV